MREYWGIRLHALKQGPWLRNEWIFNTDPELDWKVIVRGPDWDLEYFSANRTVTVHAAGRYQSEIFRIGELALSAPKLPATMDATATLERDGTGNWKFTRKEMPGSYLVYDAKAGGLTESFADRNDQVRISLQGENRDAYGARGVFLPRSRLSARFRGGNFSELFAYRLHDGTVNRELSTSQFDALRVPAGTNVFDLRRGGDAKAEPVTLKEPTETISELLAVLDAVGKPVERPSHIPTAAVVGAGVALAAAAFYFARRSVLRKPK